ncbi:MAG: glycosyltransferase [Candidatus Aureabacteria bacterium]|nr:glycosyltransferase [Candidatus Auribacterota bacterium]
MKILFVISRLEKPSSKFRVLAYLPWLRKNGFQCDVMEASKGFINRLLLPFKSLSYDVCFIQKKLLNFFELKALRACVPKIIFDYDDAILFKEDGSPNDGSRRNFIHTLEMADLVIAGNPYLGGLASPYHGRVLILPTPVDTERILPKPFECSSVPVIGWIGTDSTFQYFVREEKHWQRITQIERVKFRVISSSLRKLGLDFEFCRWDAEQEAEQLKGMDIGLMPLPDNAWTKGKCAFKVLQYQCAGVPAIASRVGFNESVIEHGKTGFLIDDHFSWEEAVYTLVHDRKLYETIARQARMDVENKYSLCHLQSVFLKTLQTL